MQAGVRGCIKMKAAEGLWFRGARLPYPECDLIRRKKRITTEDTEEH